MQKDFSPAADADSIDDMADDMIEMTDEEGNTTLFKILDYFFYNGDEYAILPDSIDEGISMPSAQQLRLQRLILSIRPSSPSRLRSASAARLNRARQAPTASR